MDPGLQRAILLLDCSRQDLAEAEIRRYLSEHPDDPEAHAMLGLCLALAEKHSDAIQAADAAVRLSPDLALAHYVRGYSLYLGKRHADAMKAVEEALRLDPSFTSAHHLESCLWAEEHRWPASLEAADRGLALDPVDVPCLNSRAMALTALGRKAEAEECLRTVLSHDANGSLGHANEGWRLLLGRDSDSALLHSRDALRSDPDSEWARRGLLESLKARNPLYRLVLALLIRLGWSTPGARARFYAVLAVLCLPAFLWGDELPVLWLLLFGGLGLMVLALASHPLLNLFLLLDPQGRVALTRDEIGYSLLQASCLIAMAGGIAAWLLTGNEDLIDGVVAVGILMRPLRSLFRARARSARICLFVVTLCFGAMGATYVWMAHAAEGRLTPALLGMVLGIATLWLLVPTLARRLEQVEIR